MAGARRWAAALLVGAVATGVHVIHPTGDIGRATYLAVTMVSAVAAVCGARRQPHDRRFPWMCVATGLMLSAIGDGIFFVTDLLTGTAPSVSPADACWVGAYIALASGLSSLVVGGDGLRKVDVDGLTDIGSFAVLAVIAVTRLPAVSDIITDSRYPAMWRAAWTAYPVLDAALLAVVLYAMMSRRIRGRNGMLLMGGAALWMLADFSSLLTADPAAISVWLDLGWMLATISFAASVWPAARAVSVTRHARTALNVSDARLLITFLPLLAPGAVELSEWGSNRVANKATMFGGGTALVTLAFFRSIRLVRARNRQDAVLERSQKYFAALAENSSDAVIVVDRDQRILNEAPNLAAKLGRPGTTTIGIDVIDLLDALDREDARRLMDRWWQTTGVVADAEAHARCADGIDHWFGVRAANLADDPIVGGMVINLRDITDRKRAEQELTHHAFHDSLTGLANRELFHDRLEHALDRTARSGLAIGVAYLDLDGFKMINDSRGHEAGDRVLRDVAERLVDAVRTTDTVARLGGDEFAVLIEESTRALGEAETVADRILQSLTTPFVVAGQEVVLSASIGITVGDNACSASSVMRDADIAMYEAKTTGKARWAVYEPSMRAMSIQQLELESALHRALDHDQLHLFYQPIVELDSGSIVGFEALLRWQHPTMGLIEPNSSIPIAESNGMIVPIGRWVLDEACRTIATWQQARPEAHLTIAVYLSARQIASPDIVEHVAFALQRSGVAPASLVLELTESVLVHDAETATRRLQELRALGVRLAIADFGTGYSSLSYLRQFPIDILKIDRSFTQTISDRARTPAIVRGLLDLAKTLQMETVAEGIELDVQLDSLRSQQCEFGQGFLFARPLDAAAATALVNDRAGMTPQVLSV